MPSRGESLPRDTSGSGAVVVWQQEHRGCILRSSRPISRVLCPRPLARSRVAIIYLGWRLPTTSSGLPGTRTERTAPCSRLLKESRVRPHCLVLLPVGVAWPPVSPRTPVVSYTTFSPSPRRTALTASPRLSSSLWPFSVRSPRPGITQHRVLGARTFLAP